MTSRFWMPVASAILALLAATTGRLQAEPALIDVTAAPVVNVQLRSGTLTIRTWDRPQVQVESDGTDVRAQHFSAEETARRFPQSVLLIGRNAQTVNGPVTLPPENIPLPPLSTGPHDGVVVRGDGDATITVPNTAALVAANVQHGEIDLHDYRNGVFVTEVFNGSTHFENVGGIGIAQVINGPITARNSDFAHVRARTLRGNMSFENCQAREIEASSIMGSILYDNGSFQPGLARFESQYGNVAIGVNGRAQIGAHSASGGIFSSGVQPGDMQRNGATDAQALFGGGGPVVTATSERGKVIIFSGMLRNHPLLAQRFPKLRQGNGGYRNEPQRRPPPPEAPPRDLPPTVKTFAAQPYPV